MRINNYEGDNNNNNNNNNDLLYSIYNLSGTLAFLHSLRNLSLKLILRNIYDNPSLVSTSSGGERTRSSEVGGGGGVYDSPSILFMTGALPPAPRDAGEYEVPPGALLQLPSSNRSSVFSTCSHESMSVSSARSSSCASVHSNASGGGGHEFYDFSNPVHHHAAVCGEFPVAEQFSRMSGKRSLNRQRDETADHRNELNAVSGIVVAL